MRHCSILEYKLRKSRKVATLFRREKKKFRENAVILREIVAKCREKVGK